MVSLVGGCFRSEGARERFTLSIVPLVAAAYLFTAPVSYGQQWDGGGTNDNWSTPANWVGDVAPATFGSANIVMAGSVRQNPNVDRPWSIFSLTFTPSFGSFNIGGQSLRISSGGITVQGGIGHTVSAPIELGGTQNWMAPFNQSSLLVYNVQTTPFQLSVRGGVDFLGTISGSGRIRFLEGATQRLYRPNSYSGGTEVVGGLIEIVDDALGTGQVTLDGGAISSFGLGIPPVSLANNFTLAKGGGTVRSNISISGDIDGPGELIIGPGSSSTVTLSAHNTYTGATTIRGGTLRADHATFGPGEPVNVQASTTFEAAGEVLRPISGNGTLTAIGSLIAGDISRTQSIEFVGSPGTELEFAL